jgi:hypothetical protein
MKVFFDENLPPTLADALSALQSRDHEEKIEVLHVADYFGQGTKDEEWIPKIAKMHGVIITLDQKISRRPSEWKLCKDYKIGIFFIAPPKGTQYWDLVQFLLKKWKEIKEKALTTERPFAYKITPRKIEQLPI